MNRSRREIRNAIRELQGLTNEWDPIGLIAAGAPDDEYDCLVAPILSSLQKGHTPREIEQWLASYIVEHFGAAPQNVEDFARRVHAWFARHNASSCDA